MKAHRFKTKTLRSALVQGGLSQSEMDTFASFNSDLVINKANCYMENLCESIKHHSLPVFGSDMCVGSSVSTILSATVAHRILGKYAKPNAAVQHTLSRECSANWVEFESNLATYDFYKAISGPDKLAVRQVLYKARSLLHTWFSKYRKENTIEVTPGETFNSSFGHVSIRAKLARKDHWTVTHDACGDFIKLVYNTRWLKKAAKAHFKKLSSREHRNLRLKCDNSMHIGFQIFSKRMLSEVLTVVQGSRGSSVPKNNEKRRFINVEPLGNVILQRQVALNFRTILKVNNNDLEVGQELHKKRIADAGLSTIDFSNASDSIITSVCEFMFPKRVMRDLLRYRSEYCLVDDVYYKVNKLSSMGNGFTFEVMTALLLAIARVLDKDATVYGDDVIISSTSAVDFIEATRAINFIVNNKKTFIAQPFRESCGAFFLEGHGYVACYDFHYIENVPDLITTVNKIRYLLEHLPDDLVIYAHLKQLYGALDELIPALFKGPVLSSFQTCRWLPEDRKKSLWSSSTVNNEWCEKSRHTRSHMNSNLQRSLFKLIRPDEQEVLKNLSDSWVIIAIPRLHLDVSYKYVVHQVRSVHAIASFFYANRTVKPVRRGTEKVKYDFYLVSDENSRYTIGELRESYRLI